MTKIMEPFWQFVLLLIPIFVILFAFWMHLRKVKQQNMEFENVPGRNRNAQPRGTQVIRNRRQRMRPQGIDENNDEVINTGTSQETDLNLEKIGTKKRAKLEAKAEKKAQRETEEQLKRERRVREEKAEEERKKEDEKKRAEEKRLEEEAKKVKEEQERKEYEEYLKMKEAFSIEEEGFEEQNEDENRNLLQEFVDYIKQNKVVVIEDLAAHFKLKTQATIDRIQDLLKDNILTGVIDDRGKFIYVSLQEMEAVAKFIKQRGRVSIAELAEHSNELINLAPTAVTS